MQVYSVLAELFRPIVVAVLTQFARVTGPDTARQVLNVRIWNYLSWLLQRLDRLALRHENGTLPKPRPTRARASRPRARPAPGDTPRLPSRAQWLCRHIEHLSAAGNYPVRQYAGQIDAFLNSDAFKSLLAAAPQAARIVRPFYRMFPMTPPEHLKLPPRPRPKKPRKPRAPKPLPHRSTSPERHRLKVPGIDTRRIPDHPGPRRRR